LRKPHPATFSTLRPGTLAHVAIRFMASVPPPRRSSPFFHRRVTTSLEARSDPVTLCRFSPPGPPRLRGSATSSAGRRELSGFFAEFDAGTYRFSGYRGRGESLVRHRKPPKTCLPFHPVSSSSFTAQRAGAVFSLCWTPRLKPRSPRLLNLPTFLERRFPTHYFLAACTLLVLRVGQECPPQSRCRADK